MSPYTNKDKPWKLVTYVAFDSEEKAVNFEKYIKVGSGYVFQKEGFGKNSYPLELKHYC